MLKKPIVFWIAALTCACSDSEPATAPVNPAAAGVGSGGVVANAAGGNTLAGGSAGGTSTVGGGGTVGPAGAGGAVAGNAGAATTGGMPGAGGGVGPAGSGTAGGGGALQSPPGFFTVGYLSRAPWMGYVFTIVDALGSKVSPVCNETGCTPAWGVQACASGTVAKNAMSATFAGLAFHANDPMGGPRGTWTSTGAGIYVSVANPPTLARLQLQEQAASDNTRYCAPLPAGGTGLIPFESFKTFCWGDAAHPSKTFTVGTKVHEVTVMVPGNSAADVPYDFCLVDIQPR